MKKNDIIELIIDDIGMDGAGIGRYDGMIFFVKDTVIGDRVTAKIMKLKKAYGYARLIEIKEASPKRVKPRCLYARSCGGCQIQQMDYQSQLEFKQKKVRGNMIRIGGFEEALIDSVMEPIVGMEEPFFYRNKAQFPVGEDAAGNIVAGFYAGRTHKIVANTDCVLGVAVNQAALEAVLGYMRDCKVSAYDESSGTGLVRHILIRYGFDSKELMVCLAVNGERLPKEGVLIERLCAIKGIKGVVQNINREKTNVILGERTKTLWGEPAIMDALYLRDTKNFQRTGEKTEYRISPQSFYQVNPIQTEKLYSLALDYAGLTGNEVVWDLYCGIGTISLFLAKAAKWVYGVEVVPQAVRDAQENAELNGILNVTFLEGKAEEIWIDDSAELKMDAGRVADTGLPRPDVIVVDPPRKGCDARCLETMLRMQPEKIVYVSCDPATLARDLQTLCAGGYELVKVRGVDQFGQTVHVETVTLLSRKNESPRIQVKMDL